MAAALLPVLLVMSWATAAPAARAAIPAPARSGSTKPAGPPPAAPALPSLVSETLAPPRAVDVASVAARPRQAARGRAAAPAPLAPPLRTKNPSAYRAAKTHPRPSSVPVVPIAVPAPAGPTAASTPAPSPSPTGSRSALDSVRASAPAPAPAPPVVSFPGVTYGQQLAGLGLAVEPPDTQVAVGAGEVLELVNVTGAVYSKTGGMLSRFGLDSFFGVPAGYHVSDPWVVWDQADRRWFASATSFNSSGDSKVYLAVSRTADATGAWNVTLVASGKGMLDDQPKLGVAGTTLLLTWNVFTSGSGSDQSGTFTGSVIVILDKA
ncbi:MAG: hypothetical protein ACRDZY_12725, partial [Acidimicrobiales bacterium]